MKARAKGGVAKSRATETDRIRVRVSIRAPLSAVHTLDVSVSGVKLRWTANADGELHTLPLKVSFELQLVLDDPWPQIVDPRMTLVADGACHCIAASS